MVPPQTETTKPEAHSCIELHKVCVCVVVRGRGRLHAHLLRFLRTVNSIVSVTALTSKYF